MKEYISILIIKKLLTFLASIIDSWLDTNPDFLFIFIITLFIAAETFMIGNLILVFIVSIYTK